MGILTMNDFITKVFNRYPPKGDDTILKMKLTEYRELLKSDTIYNYDNAYNRLVSSYKQLTTPSIDELRDVLNKNIIKEHANTETSYNTETLIVRKGNYEYEFGVDLTNYVKDIMYFKREGFSILKLKFCKKGVDCPRCNYNHVCLTAQEVRAV